MGPSAFCSSPRPMHWPELCPVHGIPPISGRPPTGAVLVNSGRIGHDVGHADVGELVFGFAACACRDRRRRAAGRRNGEHCDRRSSSDRDSESPRKDQSSSWKLEGRHRHAFSSLLAVSSGKGTDRCQRPDRSHPFPCLCLFRSCGRSWHLLAQAYPRQTHDTC